MQKLYFVHGMGSHGAGWADDAVKVFRDAWKSWPSLQHYFPFEDTIDPVQLTYGSAFDDYIDRQKKKHGDLKAALKVIGVPSELIKTAEKAIGAIDGSGFAQTHILDVLFWRFATQMRSRVTSDLADQIRGHHPKGKAFTFSVIAHSLGTSVIHDVLHDMAAQDYKLGAREPSFRVGLLAMVANTSKVLDLPERSVYTSHVRPAKKLVDGVCRQYVTIGNRLDPFWQVDEFSPADSWKPPYAAVLPLYQDLYFTHAGNINPHDLTMYLSNPFINTNLFRRLASDDVFSKAENDKIAEMITEFSRKLPPEADAILKSYSAMKEAASIEGFVSALIKFSTALGKLGKGKK